MTDLLTPRPKSLSLATQLISTFVRAPLFLLATVAFGSASLAASLLERNGRLQHRIAQAWAAFSMRCGGARMTILGAENLLRVPVAVYVSNHLSYMDTPAIFSSLPFQFRIVARSSLWKVPFIGWHLNRSGQIPVNVDNPRSSIASLGGGVKTLKEGMPLFIFPEGGRSNDGHLQAFMNGPAFMAVRARVPIVPMALIGTYELLPIHTKVFYPVPVVLAVGEPIETSSYSLRQVDALTRLLGQKIAELYYRHSYLAEPAHINLEDATTPVALG
jgi:1-acyl-sn-glycerol-3-phosphate acyltransferase